MPTLLYFTEFGISGYAKYETTKATFVFFVFMEYLLV